MVKPTEDQINKWAGECPENKYTVDYVAEQAFAAGMEEAANICDDFTPDESNPLTTEGQCADAIRAAIPKEKE